MFLIFLNSSNIEAAGSFSEHASENTRVLVFLLKWLHILKARSAANSTL